MQQFTVAALINIAYTLLGGWIAWLLVRRSQARMEAQAAIAQRILERFESAREAAEFLETPAGRRLLGKIGGGTSTTHKVLGMVGPGIILSVIGFGMILATKAVDEPRMVLGGAVILASGIGCLLAVLISRRLALRWGLVDEVDARRANGLPGQP